MKAAAVMINEFELPELTFTLDALEPYIDKKTMEVHYKKHHKGYIDKLNNAVRKESVEENDLETLLRGISLYDDDIRNNGGGHFNHTFFWSILTPTPTDLGAGPLKKAIKESFYSFDKLKEDFLKAATSRFGSGWAWLVVNPNGNLEIGSTPNQDSPIMDVAEFRGEPILGLDVWEHAYYLTYQNKRAEYVEAFWNIVNWDEVARKYDEAMANLEK